GNYTELPNGPSWQFISADHVFPNPQNPFQPPAYPEFAEITDLQANAVRDFVAIKTGDVTDCTGDTQGPAFLTALASSASGQTGQQVTIDVTVQDFADVSGLQFSMQWDPAVASLDQFAGVTNLNPALPLLTDLSFNTAQAAAGKLSVCWWTDLIAGPQALPNNTVLFSLTFTLVGPSGSSTPVAFVQTPTKFEVVNGGCDPFGLNTDDGQISITGQPPPPPASLQFVSGNATSVNGAAVCAPVCTSNFTDIVSAQFSLGWDPAVFDFQQVKNFNPALSGLNSSNFFTGQSGNGLLGFGWYDLTANGVSLPNGAVLFEVCFTPVGSNGSSTPFSFPNGPALMEVTDKAGATVPVQTVSGTLNIISGSAAPITVSVSPADQTVPGGTAVSVQIQAKDFSSIAGYQFSMNWVPAVLHFQSASPALPGMTSGNFNTGNAANGTLSHLYYALNPGPLTLPDGSVLFTLNFIAVGAPGTSSPINFTAMPTSIAAYDGDLQPVPVTTLAGIVHIAGGACGITCPSSVPALSTDTRCRAVLGDYTGLATITGDCIGTITQTPAPGTVVNPGTVAVTMMASAASGEQVTCVFNVTVSGGCGN
ncbi:MAG: cohesin domain-containing protein, partial [Saprospiraceae bacterium]